MNAGAVSCSKAIGFKMKNLSIEANLLNVKCLLLC
jgi:hypothetical protein